MPKRRRSYFRAQSFMVSLLFQDGFLRGTRTRSKNMTVAGIDRPNNFSLLQEHNFTTRNLSSPKVMFKSSSCLKLSLLTTE